MKTWIECDLPRPLATSGAPSRSPASIAHRWETNLRPRRSPRSRRPHLPRRPLYPLSHRGVASWIETRPFALARISSSRGGAPAAPPRRHDRPERPRLSPGGYRSPRAREDGNTSSTSECSYWRNQLIQAMWARSPRLSSFHGTDRAPGPRWKISSGTRRSLCSPGPAPWPQMSDISPLRHRARKARGRALARLLGDASCAPPRPLPQ